MASITYNLAKKKILDGTLNLSSDTIKAMIVGPSYTPNADHDFVDMGGANDPVDHEVDGTAYTKGFGSASRKTLGSKTFTESDANDNAVMSGASFSWPGIGPTTPTQGAWVLLIKEITNDAASLLIACIDIADITFNGTDYQVDPHATDGFLKMG